MLLGLFLPIHSGGWSITTYPRGTDWTFDYNATLTQRAEALGFDLAFGPAHWLSKGGFGGVTRYRETALDPFAVTVALAAVTRRILLVSTVHILYGPVHPLRLAKLGATVDHISQGRWGLNMVTGFRLDEARMFGGERAEHDLRYEMAGEFVDIMLRLWTEDENLSYRGRFWTLHDAYVTPRPHHHRPFIVNATGSPAGIDFAARYSDLVFITSPAGIDIDDALAVLPGHNAAIKRAAAARGREIRTMINPLIICRETEAEARQLYDAILAHTDFEALRGFLGSHATGDSRAWPANQPDKKAVGGNIQIVGTPQQVADRIVALKRAGCDGIQISFFDYQPELEFFGARVIPLLQQAGLRI
jgi:dimethylsulfone monooxygenase